VLKIIETMQAARFDRDDPPAGETGTGRSSRPGDPPSARRERLTVNRAELSGNSESELFTGRSFTDAKASKTGLFERASGGTVFIDEIDTASRHFHVALLRVVDRKEIKPVGSTESISVDVRILCAANKDLRAEVENDRFLKDLYYRLRVVSSIFRPSERKDVPILADISVEARFEERKRWRVCPR
jgi:DNA-binding NtrC family response regulator